MLEAIDRDPQAAFRAVGLSPRRAGEAVRSWDELRSTRALHLLLAPHGLAWLVPRIEEHYAGRGHRVVRERPYDLTAVFGVGFQVADRIARAQGVAADSPARARAGVVHVLAEAERNGSTCLPVGELAAAAGELLGAAPDAQLLAGMAERGELVLEPGAGEVLWAYRPQTAELEAELAERVRELAGGRARLTRPRGSGRRRRPGARPGRRRAGGDDLAAVDRHRRPRHRQDRDDPDDLRRGRRAGRDRAARRARPAAPRGG